jgi:hypothetical protein
MVSWFGIPSPKGIARLIFGGSRVRLRPGLEGRAAIVVAANLVMDVGLRLTSRACR